VVLQTRGSGDLCLVPAIFQTLSDLVSLHCKASRAAPRMAAPSPCRSQLTTTLRRWIWCTKSR